MDEGENSFFNSVVMDAVHQIGKSGSAIVFSMDQVRAIQRIRKDVTFEVKEGFYYVKGDVGEKVRKKNS